MAPTHRVLTRDHIEALLQQLPTKEEVALVRSETEAAGGAAAGATGPDPIP